VGPRIAVALVATALAALLVVEGLVLDAAPLPLEEAAVAAEARGGESPYVPRLTGVYPQLLRPLASRGDRTSLLDDGRQLNAFLWALIIVPAYALARRRVPPLAALAAAAAAVLVPGAVYAATLLPEAAGVLLAVTSMALFVRDGRASLAAASAFAVAAAFVRPWFAALPLALGLAFALQRLRFRVLSVWPRPLALVLLASVAVTGLAGISGDLARGLSGPGAILRGALASIGAAALGGAVLPYVAAFAQAGRARTDPAIALLVTCTPLLALAAGIAVASRDGPRVDERPLLALGPLAFAIAPDVLQRRNARALLGSGAFVAVAILALGVPLGDPALVNAPGAALLAAATDDTLGRGALVAAAAVAVGGAAVLAFTRPRPLALAGAVLMLVLASHAAAWQRLDAAADAQARALGAPSGWVDAWSNGADVTVLSAAPPPVDTVAQLVVSNRSLRAVAEIDPSRTDTATGALSARVDTPLVLARDVDVLGETLADSALGSLRRVDPPARLAVLTDGAYPDGWTGARAAYRRFGGAAPRAVTTTLSRASWTGPDVPGAVVVASGPLGAKLAPRARFVIHSGEERAVTVPVPAPPFEIVVTVSPTFSPADFGAGDTRQLGVRASFREEG